MKTFGNVSITHLYFILIIGFTLSVAKVAAIPPDEYRPKLLMLDGSIRSVEPTASPRTKSDATDQILGTTGGDICGATTVVPVPVGPLGSPITTMITGDNTGATAADCTALGFTVWWESFQITEYATITIDFCGTSPSRGPDFITVSFECPCGGFQTASSFTRSICGDNNATITFNALQPGTYYYPVFSEGSGFPNSLGPYQMNISAQHCTGSCCVPGTGTCSEDVLEADCTGIDEIFTCGLDCCETECRTSPPEFGSSGVSLLSQVPLNQFSTSPGHANDIWGYVSDTGREYALIGLACAVGVVEVTDPLNPVIIGEISGPCSTWRDMRTFGTKAYVVIESTGNGLQIIDLSNVDSGTVSLQATVTPNGFADAHNIAINEESGFAYAASSNIGSIAAFDLSDPANPTLAGSRLLPSIHDIQVVSYTSGPYAGREIAFVSAPGIGLFIVDVTDKNNMFTVSQATYLFEWIAHQGWLSKDRRYFFLGDEGDETNFGVPTTTYVINVEDINNPFLSTSFSNNLCAIDHNMIVVGDHLFQANYSTGLRVFNVSDINNVQEIGHFDTHPEDDRVDYVGAWGVYPLLPSGNILISDIERGLFVLDANEIVSSACYDLANNTCQNNVTKENCQNPGQQWVFGESCGVPSPPLPDPDSPGGLACGGGPKYGLPCSTCDPGGQLCTDSDVCGGNPCVPTDALCGEGFTCGSNAAADVINNPWPKNRYLGFLPPSSWTGKEIAIRLTAVDVPSNPNCKGEVRWAGPPREYSEDQLTRFQASKLEITTTPLFRDWTTFNLPIQLYGEEINPGSLYSIQAIDIGSAAALDIETNYSDGLLVKTAVWGDVIKPVGAIGAVGQPNIDDVLALVGKWLSQLKPWKVISQLQPGVLTPADDLTIDDVLTGVNAWLGSPYPFNVESCP